MDVSDFEKWQAAGEERSVRIDICTNYSGENETTIWVYDSLLLAGQYVKSVKDIDLAAAKERVDRETWNRLKKRFGEAA